MGGIACFTCAFLASPPLSRYNGWNCMLHVCFSGISSIVTVMDPMELDASRVPFSHLLHCGGNGWNWMITGHKKYTLRWMETHKISRLTII